MMPTLDTSTVTVFYNNIDGWVAVDSAYPTLSGIGETRTDAYKALVSALRLGLQVQEAEVRRVRGLLDELLADDDETGQMAILRWSDGVLGYLCPFCNGGNDHTVACVVTRARALGSGTAAD